MAAQPMSGIYEIVNLVNGKRYVGSAKSFQHRWATHRSQLERGIHHSVALNRAWNKYGKENFGFRILEYCAVSDLLAREQMAIDRIKPEYNICKVAGSSAGRSPSAETRKKLSEALKGRVFSHEHKANHLAAARTKNWVPTQEWRDKLSASRKGKKASPEARAKMSAARQGKPRPDLRGRKWSPETREKILAARVGKKRGPYKRKAQAAGQ